MCVHTHTIHTHVCVNWIKCDTVFTFFMLLPRELTPIGQCRDCR